MIRPFKVFNISLILIKMIKYACTTNTLREVYYLKLRNSSVHENANREGKKQNLPLNECGKKSKFCM